jgi:DNA-binding HxlR family transcriptional regulator
MSRTYDQYCPVARALEFLGERWTLLVIRELMLGPRRFTDLMDELPGISTNVLATRLKDLEDTGMVRKRVLPPPAGSTVYELTESSAGVAPVLVAMAEWGMTLLDPPRKSETVPPRSIVLGLSVTATPGGDADDGVYELHVDDEVFELRVDGGYVVPRQGPANVPEAVITLPARTLAAIALDAEDLDRSISRGVITIDGDDAGARRLLERLTHPRSTN